MVGGVPATTRKDADPGAVHAIDAACLMAVKP
jgi:hypothetical protein